MTDDFWIIVESREETAVTVTSVKVADEVTPVLLVETKEESIALSEGNEVEVLEDKEDVYEASELIEEAIDGAAEIK